MSFMFQMCRKVVFSFIVTLPLLMSFYIATLQAATSDWKNVSDRRIARMLFPDQKLYFQPSLEGLPMPDPASLDGVNVYGIKRIVANFDNDSEPELAVAVHYTTGMCTFCASNMIFGILDRRGREIRIAWRTEEGQAFENSEVRFSTMKIGGKGRFSALSMIYDGTPVGTGSSYSKMKIVRWNGRRFAEIWNYDLEESDQGARGGTPHDYLANVEFIDAARIIRVTSMYVTRPHMEEKRSQGTLSERFAWSDKEQTYKLVGQSQVAYENGRECFSRKNAPKEEMHCNEFGETPIARGEKFLDGGGYYEAVRAFNEALEENPASARAFFGRARAYQSLNDRLRASADFEEALKLDPKSVNIYLYRAFGYSQNREYDRAIADYTSILEINPGPSEAYLYRAEAYQQNGQFQEAISDYTVLIERNPTVSNYVRRGSLYYLLGDYDRAITDYSTGLGLQPDHPWAFYNRALAFWNKGQIDLALADLSELTRGFLVPPESYYYRGRMYMEKGDYHRGTADFDKAIETASKGSGYRWPETFIDLYFFTAQAYEQAGQTNKAIAAYKSVIRHSLMSTSPLVTHARGRITELEKHSR
jgi:tetratricopeptide (TPR) repeat protein